MSAASEEQSSPSRKSRKGFEVGVGAIKTDDQRGLTLNLPGSDTLDIRSKVGSAKSGFGTPLRTPAVMPSYSQVSSSPSVAAGVPVLELIRKF